MTFYRSIVGFVVLVTLAGCSSAESAPGSTSAGSGPAASASVADQGTPDAKRVYAQVKDVVLKAGTGAFSQTSTTKVGDGSVIVSIDGSYDLNAKAWVGQERFESDSPTYLAKSKDLSQQTINYRGLGAESYTSRLSWPKPLRGRWQHTSLRKTAGKSADLIGGPQDPSPEMLGMLLNLTPTAAKRTGTGWTLQGRISAPLAIIGLGIAKTFRQQGVSVVKLKGAGVVSVDVAASGQPTEVRIDGGSVKLTSTVPDDLHTLVSAQHGVLKILEVGRPVTVPEPKGHQLLTPAEAKSLSAQ